jgi:hypothetical protein
MTNLNSPAGPALENEAIYAGMRAVANIKFDIKASLKKSFKYLRTTCCSLPRRRREEVERREETLADLADLADPLNDAEQARVESSVCA